MALTPTIELCVQSSCTELVFKETTGAYSATNTGGYGAPNVTINNIVSAVLTVTSPSDVEYEIDLFTEDFPTTDTEFEYIIDLDDIGSPTTITDGQWSFIYRVTTDADVVYTANASYLFTCNSQCCVAQMLANIEPDSCDCNVENVQKINDYLKAKAFLESLKHAAYCGNLSRFTKIKALIDKLCAKVDCPTCN